MWVYTMQLLPVLALLLIYFFRIERRLTRIETNITWLIKNTEKCQQSSEKNTT